MPIPLTTPVGTRVRVVRPYAKGANITAVIVEGPERQLRGCMLPFRVRLDAPISTEWRELPCDEDELELIAIGVTTGVATLWSHDQQKIHAEISVDLDMSQGSIAYQWPEVVIHEDEAYILDKDDTIGGEVSPGTYRQSRFTFFG